MMMSLKAMEIYYIAAYVWFVIGALYVAIPAFKTVLSFIFGKEEK